MFKKKPEISKEPNNKLSYQLFIKGLYSIKLRMYLKRAQIILLSFFVSLTFLDLRRHSSLQQSL